MRGALCQQPCIEQGTAQMALNGMSFRSHPCSSAMLKVLLPVQLSGSTIPECSNPSPAAPTSESYVITQCEP